MKKTLILGTTPNSTRYAYKAAQMLTTKGHPVIPVGIKKGEIMGKEIINSKDLQQDIDTITLYIGPQHQEEWYEYILKTKPRRIIFNPGTENNELVKLATQDGIETVEGCTLVMLSAELY